MSSAGTPAPPADPASGPAHSRTGALASFSGPEGRKGLGVPPNPYYNSTSLWGVLSGPLVGGLWRIPARSGFQSAPQYLIPPFETCQGSCGSRAVLAAARGRFTAGAQSRSNM